METIKCERKKGKSKKEPGLYSACITLYPPMKMCWLNFHSLVPWGRKDLESLMDCEMFFGHCCLP